MQEWHFVEVDIVVANRKSIAITSSLYAVLILILFFIYSILVPDTLRYYLLKETSLVLSVSLIFYAIGSIASLASRTRTGLIFKSYIFWSVFLFLFMFYVFIYAVPSNYADYILPLYILTEAAFLFYFGSRNTATGAFINGGLVASGIGKSLFLLSLGLFAYTYHITRTYSYFFIPPALYTFINSFTSMFVDSKIEAVSNFGRYMVRSGNLYPWISVLIGLLLVIYEYPKPAYLDSVIIVLILFISILAILSASWRIYYAASHRIRGISDDVFQKHKKNRTIYSDSSLDSVMHYVDEFRVSGNKERLIITLTMILSTAGNTLEECNEMLRSLISYQPPDPLTFKRFSTRNRVEREILFRDKILKEIVNEMKKHGVGN